MVHGSKWIISKLFTTRSAFIRFALMLQVYSVPVGRLVSNMHKSEVT